MEDVVLADFLASKGNKRKQSVTREMDVGKKKNNAVAVKVEQSGKAGDSGDNVEKFMEEKSNSNGGEIMKSFLSSPGECSSRLRPRKEIPIFRKVELEDGDSEKIVGKRIKVYWSGSRRWFLGRIKSFDNTKCLHKIHYEDGDKEDLDLGCELFELELMPSDSFTLKTEPTSVKKIKGSDGDQASEIMKDDLFNMGDSEQVRFAADVLPEKVEKTIKGDVHGTEELGNATCVKDSNKSKSILEVCTEAIKSGKASATKAGDGSEDIEKAVKGDCLEAHDATPLKRYVRVKKKVAPGAAKMSGSKLHSEKETKLIENPAANLEVDMQHVEAKTELTQGESNAQDALDVKSDEHCAKNASGKNDGISKEARASREEMGGDRQKHKKVIIKFPIPSKHATNEVKDDEMGIVAYVKFSDQTKKVEENDMNLKINVEGPSDGNAAMSYGGNESLLETASERLCQAPADLQNKLNVENTESVGRATKTSSLSRQELAGNETLAGDIQMDLASQEAAKAVDGGDNKNVENQKIPLRRGRSTSVAK